MNNVDTLDSQSMFFDCISSFINNNKLSHAYLVESRDCPNKKQIIDRFVEMLYSANSSEIISMQTIKNDGNYLEISSDSSSMIKKDQILDIQEKFMTKSLNQKCRIYVIYDADKLNKQAANSLLKFLEEPEENIIGILVADNRYKVLETIRSRCQILSLINTNYYIPDHSVDFINNFISMLEKKKLHAIAYLQTVTDNQFYTKEQWNEIFYLVEYIYENALRYKYGVKFDDNFIDIISLIASSNTADTLLKKITVLNNQIEKLEYNLNLNLMFDQFVIEFVGR